MPVGNNRAGQPQRTRRSPPGIHGQARRPLSLAPREEMELPKAATVQRKVNSIGTCGCVPSGFSPAVPTPRPFSRSVSCIADHYGPPEPGRSRTFRADGFGVGLVASRSTAPCSYVRCLPCPPSPPLASDLLCRDKHSHSGLFL